MSYLVCFFLAKEILEVHACARYKVVQAKISNLQTLASFNFFYQLFH